MSSNRRRNSSRQLLQNLIRVTAQRSQEDAEEVERERRRRAREIERGEGGPSWPEPTHRHDDPHRTELEEELKPRCCPVLEEDEGFSDWSHRLENRNEQEVQELCRVRQRTAGRKEQDQDGGEGREQERRSRAQKASARPAEKTPCSKKDVRTSYSSSVFVSQDARLQHGPGHPADRASYLAAGTMRPRGAACREDEEVEEEEEDVRLALQREQRSPVTRQSHGEEDEQEDEELSFTGEEVDVLHLRREQRNTEEEEEQEEEEHKTPKRSVGDTRSEEANRRPASSLCSDGEEPLNYGPMSPTFKKLLIQFYPDEINSRVSTDGKCTIMERTESLRRSCSGTKKTPPPVAVSKIDKKLELYTQALELSSKEGRSGAQQLTDLTSPTEPVAAKKNLFEAGDAWNQNISVTGSKQEADGLKVGVSDLINQWVRGGDDGSRCSSPSKPTEIKPGGVLNKKNLWESFGDTSSPGRDGKESSSGKKYKFVVTSHGKYQKVSADDGGGEDVKCLSAGDFYEDL